MILINYEVGDLVVFTDGMAPPYGFVKKIEGDIVFIGGNNNFPVTYLDALLIKKEDVSETMMEYIGMIHGT